MYLQRLMTLADELRTLSGSRFFNIAAVESRFYVRTERYPAIYVKAEGYKAASDVLYSLITGLGYRESGEGIGLTIVRSGVPAALTIFLPEPSSRLILRTWKTVERLGIGATGSAILDVSEALLGDREAAKAVALSILLETMADERVARVLDDLSRIKEILTKASLEVRSL